MKLTEALKKYFGRYDEDDEEKKKKKKIKKTPPIKAGSYFKKKRGRYEEALKEADKY
jgi:hypothetical protein